MNVQPSTAFRSQAIALAILIEPPFLHKPGLSPLQQVVDRVVGERVGIVAIGVALTK